MRVIYTRVSCIGCPCQRLLKSLLVLSVKCHVDEIFPYIFVTVENNVKISIQM